MKVLITGREGQLGYCLTNKLAFFAEVLALTRNDLDITDRSAVDDVFSSFRPNFVINAAAYTAVDKAEEEVEASYKVNRDGPRYLAEASEKYGTIMIHISTDYVFDGMGNAPYTELDSSNPIGVYGKSKLAGEAAIIDSCQKYLILRTSWVFGEHGNNFVKTILRIAKERDKLSIVSDQIGGPTYAGDIANAVLIMMNSVEGSEQPKWGIYHFSGLPYISWFGFAEEIIKHAVDAKTLIKKNILEAIDSDSYPTVAKRPANSRLDCKKIEEQFGILPSDWQLALNNIQDYE